MLPEVCRDDGVVPPLQVAVRRNRAWLRLADELERAEDVLRRFKEPMRKAS
jgi:hypothetical protein